MTMVTDYERQEDGSYVLVEREADEAEGQEDTVRIRVMTPDELDALEYLYAQDWVSVEPNELSRTIITIDDIQAVIDNLIDAHAKDMEEGVADSWLDGLDGTWQDVGVLLWALELKKAWILSDNPDTVFIGSHTLMTNEGYGKVPKTRSILPRR